LASTVQRVINFSISFASTFVHFALDIDLAIRVRILGQR
jgi:hypothetical protein